MFAPVIELPARSVSPHSQFKHATTLRWTFGLDLVTNSSCDSRQTARQQTHVYTNEQR